MSTRLVDGVLENQRETTERVTVVHEPARAKVAPEPARAGTAAAIARRGALALGIVLVAFVLFATEFAGLAHARSQVGLQRRFRSELANTQAPIGGIIAAGSPVAMLEATRIGVNEVVVEGTRSGQLRGGPGHLVGSPLPGQPGNAVIGGRRTFYGGPFRHLSSLRAGDEIRVTTGQGTATYDVKRVTRARAEDGSVFADHGDDRLTLFTADPAINPTRRLVVVSQLVGKPFAAQPVKHTLDADGLGLSGDSGAIAPVLVWLELLVAAALLAVFALTRWSRLTTWIVFAPAIALLAWMVFENAVRLLPATL